MANQRMYLACACGEKIKLGKRMGDGYYTPPEQSALGEFYDAHEFCGGNLDHFSLEYEHEANWDHAPEHRCAR